jgi:hypothetical protein
MLLNWQTIDPIATRLVASALFAIGGISFFSAYSEILVYRHVLILKIIWSCSAIVGILLTLFLNGAPLFNWIVLGIFTFFALLWFYYYRILGVKRMSQ